MTVRIYDSFQQLMDYAYWVGLMAWGAYGWNDVADSNGGASMNL